MGLAADRAWHLKSWDRFTIPKWRARIIVSYTEPILVRSDAGDDELARVTEQMKQRMVAAEEDAFRRLGVAPDW